MKQTVAESFCHIIGTGNDYVRNYNRKLLSGKLNHSSAGPESQIVWNAGTDCAAFCH